MMLIFGQVPGKRIHISIISQLPVPAVESYLPERMFVLFPDLKNNIIFAPAKHSIFHYPF
jgi:hypothetical protein